MRRILFIILLLLLAAPPTRAGIRPSFHLPYCSWFATHVVVVTEGEKIDGSLTVLESWKGDLAPGDVAVIQTMTEIGGGDVGEELTRIVGEELAFWKATGPGLKRGWWNAIHEPDTEDLRERYMKLHAALRGLKRLGHEGSHAVVTELRNHWLSLPQLGEDGTDGITVACDEVLDGRVNPSTQR